MIESILSVYRPAYIDTMVYMLQSTEYQAVPYLRWYWRTNNFSQVVKRKTLDKTLAAQALKTVLTLGIITQIFIGLWLISLSLHAGVAVAWPLGLALLISYPVVWAHLIIIPLVLGRVFIVKPREHKQVVRSKQVFHETKAITIAITGSYGKTSMKELLLTVLSEGKKVAATPANKNVPTEHAKFAHQLKGDEDILLIEYGEGRPGDVKRFTAITKPDIAVITGIAPAHLDHYKSLDAAAKDIFSVAGSVSADNVFVNQDSEFAEPYITPEFQTYSSKGALGWEVSNVKISLEGTSFALKKGNKQLLLHSKLLGRHQIGPLALAAALAGKLGLSKKQIETGISKTAPYEHRMQPYNLHGAWVIDDTYNGNLEGIKAGLALLQELPAKRKIYVTPGLVDQGQETKRVHTEMGKAIATAKPDKVILMNNPVTPIIESGIRSARKNLAVSVVNDPLRFYTNLDQFVSAGDLVLMQNDWTDNYN